MIPPRDPMSGDPGRSGSIPVAPSLEPTLAASRGPEPAMLVDRRVLRITGIAGLIGIAAGIVADGLAHLINLCTNLAFHGRLSFEGGSPWDHHLGLWVIAIPAI